MDELEESSELIEILHTSKSPKNSDDIEIVNDMKSDGNESDCQSFNSEDKISALSSKNDEILDCDDDNHDDEENNNDEIDSNEKSVCEQLSAGGVSDRYDKVVLDGSPASSTRAVLGIDISSDSEVENENVNVTHAGDDDGDKTDASSNEKSNMAQIFGSDSEGEQFEGFQEEEVEESILRSSSKKRKRIVENFSESEDNDESSRRKQAHVEGMDSDDAKNILPELSDEDDEDNTQKEEPNLPDRREAENDYDDEERLERVSEVVSDFDMMLERKRIERKNSIKKRNNVDVINDADEQINVLIKEMRTACEFDRRMNGEKKPAFAKLKLLPIVVTQLNKIDMQSAFLDAGILPVLSEWLQPLPDKSLPNIRIRQEILKVLQDLPSIDASTLKSSYIGKAVMYLFKHPKEIKANKLKAKNLINEWSRNIFNIPTDFKSLSNEERSQRTSNAKSNSTEGRHLNDISTGSTDTQTLRPGQPGFVMRARVPQISMQNYTVRPKPRVVINPRNKKTDSNSELRLKRVQKAAKEQKQQFFASRKVNISGSNLSI